MAFQKVEFEFPDEQEEESTEIEIEPSGEIEVDISGKEPVVEAVVEPEVEPELEVEVVDDTPEKDRNRTPSAPPEDVTDEEEEGPRWGATGLKKVVRGQRKVHMGGVGVGFASWKQN